MVGISIPKTHLKACRESTRQLRQCTDQFRHRVGSKAVRQIRHIDLAGAGIPEQIRVCYPRVGISPDQPSESYGSDDRDSTNKPVQEGIPAEFNDKKDQCDERHSRIDLNVEASCRESIRPLVEIHAVESGQQQDLSLHGHDPLENLQPSTRLL